MICSGIEGETRSMVAANYSHWDTLSDKDSVSLQVNNGPKYFGENHQCLGSITLTVYI